jgi:hypothetical protein
MKNCVILFLLFVSLSIAHTQDNIICIHPKIGDTVSLNEKNNFKLFPHIQDTNYSSAVIHQVKDSYYLNIFYSDNTFSAQEIDSADLSSYFQNIENQVMNSANNEILENKINMKPLIPANEKPKGDRLITPETRKEIGYEKRK